MGRGYVEVAHAFKARRDAERQGLTEASFAPLDDQLKAEAERFGMRFVPLLEFDAYTDALDTALKVHEVLWLRQHTKWVGRAPSGHLLRKASARANYYRKVRSPRSKPWGHCGP